MRIWLKVSLFFAPINFLSDDRLVSCFFFLLYIVRCVAIVLFFLFFVLLLFFCCAFTIRVSMRLARTIVILL